MHSKFLKQVRDEFGTARLEKQKSSPVWFIECVVWPPSGGRKLFHVKVCLFQKGWLIIWEMLKDFLGKFLFV